LIIGIDFTLSNGDPENVTSLHYVDPEGVKLNPYEYAINSVGRILIDYDRDGVVPVFGFGARLVGPNGKHLPAAHCIPLHGEGSQGCLGIDGVLDTYRKFLKTVWLSGPTMFAPLINASTDITSANPCTLVYFL
jgi:hypothetical protein